MRANCCRWRTVSATMSNRPASEPPIWRWIVTAVITNVKFFEPTRSAMSASASSIGLPSCVSVSTRLNSLGGRLGALVDDRLDALAEAVAGLERRGDRDQQVGQLVLELAGRAPCAFERDVADRGAERRSPSAPAISSDDDAEHARRSRPSTNARAGADRRAARRAGAAGRRARAVAASCLNCLHVRERILDRVDEACCALPRGLPCAARLRRLRRRAAMCGSMRALRRAARGVRRTRSSSESRIRPPTTSADQQRADRAVAGRRDQPRRGVRGCAGSKASVAS